MLGKIKGQSFSKAFRVLQLPVRRGEPFPITLQTDDLGFDPFPVLEEGVQPHSQDRRRDGEQCHHPGIFGEKAGGAGIQVIVPHHLIELIRTDRDRLIGPHLAVGIPGIAHDLRGQRPGKAGEPEHGRQPVIVPIDRGVDQRLKLLPCLPVRAEDEGLKGGIKAKIQPVAFLHMLGKIVGSQLGRYGAVASALERVKIVGSFLLAFIGALHEDIDKDPSQEEGQTQDQSCYSYVKGLIQIKQPHHLIGHRDLLFLLCHPRISCLFLMVR